MNSYSRCLIIVFLICLFFFAFVEPVVADDSDVVVEFFHSSGQCDSCDEIKTTIDKIEDFFGNKITVVHYPVDFTTYIDNYNKFKDYGFVTIPGVVVKNISSNKFDTFSYDDLKITGDEGFEVIKNAINYHLVGNYSEEPLKSEPKELCFDTPFGSICLNHSELSLPLLTIILGAIDSVNPCSFFVLLFLLSLLLHTKSRKRMLLVGGIFIFFSGFIYFLLMVAMLFFFFVVEQQLIIMVIAGIVALIFGGFNIKDFFFFKKGPSLGIPESKKSKLFKQMSKIVKMPSVFPVIIATVILAVSANTVELLCSFNIPFVYTGILTSYNLDITYYYLYILFYNIIYIIPLLILVAVVVVTLGRWKLSEWQGRNLKLFSGIMIFSLGLILLINHELLENVFAAFGILLMSVVITVVISSIWKMKFCIDK